ncbi:DUF3414 domain-containing protein [Cephalotus follicularis]|uniref:DUF3414 domain-containing protein n=1 Tax=Cephalotus follicularis TaxID=3775 RepID=A0A1Q3CWW5_CEPFO|nr:DUF3414 domain-containing protein [Cephalotus follicularis]
MSNSTSVDSSLWWDPFSSLLTELENASSLSTGLPPSLVKKLKDNHAWFVHTVSLFKRPNEKSKEALNSQQLKIGSHHLNIKPDVKDKALQISSFLCLDEVQSYILVERSLEQNDAVFYSIIEEFFHMFVLRYYIERQCLLKCTRQILMHSLCVKTSSKEGNGDREEAEKLISDGLESKLISVLQSLLSSSHPEQMDVDFFTLWAEETLIEDNLILEILFLIYYESFCNCNGETWKKLCLLYKGILTGSYNFGKLAISTEALDSANNAKVQLLLILIETLGLENLLQMVHDEVPFRLGASTFLLSDVLEMDAIISSFDAFEMKEASPLVLTWAAFLCLLSSLPGKEETSALMEIDHIGYVRQAFEAESLGYFLEILESELLKESEGPVSGYRSVLRTFVSAFIASYEINLKSEDGTLNLILDILCKIYRGEESLCVQFWDRESFIDGPIRCLLFSLEGEFPFRTAEFVRFLSCLCEGSWPAECVYNFLHKSVGISSLFEYASECLVDNISQTVITHLPLHVPGVEGLLIPSNCRGHVLKIIGETTALVRWEYPLSAVVVLLLRLAQDMFRDRNEEVLPTLDLLSRMVSFNTAVCFALMDIGNTLHTGPTSNSEQMEKRIWMVEIICTLVRKLPPNSSSAMMISMGVNIVTKMLKCSPSLVASVALKENMFDMAPKSSIFDVGYNGSSSGSWLLSGRLAKMLLMDCERNDYECPLAISVLDFTMQLVETGSENDCVLALVVFSLQYILVNHECWKYRVKHVRWKVTLKVYEMMKACITSVSYSEKFGEVIRDMLLSDSSIHNTLFRVVCTTKQTLEKFYVSRLFELVEIEGLQLAIGSVLDVIYIMLSKFSKDVPSSLSMFHQAVLSSTTKPIPVFAAVVSLISYFHNPAIQVGAARVLSMLLTIADNSQPYLLGHACFGLDDKQVTELRCSVNSILLEQAAFDEDLFVAIVDLLTFATRYQPTFLFAIFGSKENTDVELSDSGGVNQSISFGSPGFKKPSMPDVLLQYVERSNDLINRKPHILVSVLNFFKALWQGAGQYTDILDWLKSFESFWKQLSNSISAIATLKAPQFEHMSETEALNSAYKYQCQSAILEIMACDMFLKKKLLHVESFVKQGNESKGRIESAASAEKSKNAEGFDLEDILSSWSESSVLDSLIKSYTSCEYDHELHFRAKVAVSIFIVHVMLKLAIGNAGSLSVSLLEKIHGLSEMLSCQPAFPELLAQYSRHGYSERKDLKNLILSDLYYQLQGELEGRNIGPGPFKELSQYLIESKKFQIHENKYGSDIAITKDVYLFDLLHLRADLQLVMWDYSEWKASKSIAETMLHCMQEVNSMALLANSKLSALKALINVLIVYSDNSGEQKLTIGGKIPDQLTLSCIGHICHSLLSTVESLAPVLDASKDILNFLEAQAELLLHLVRSVWKNLSIRLCVLVSKTSGSALRVLSDLRASVAGVKMSMKLLLMLLLSAVEFSCINSHLDGVTDMEFVEDVSEVSTVNLGLIPTLCNCIKISEHFTLSLTIMDVVLRSFITPSTWFPIIHKHLPLQLVLLKFQDKKSLPSIPIILKFFLTLARVREGATMLLSAGFLLSLRVLFADDGLPSSVIYNEKHLPNQLDKCEMPQHIWGLGLAVVAALVHSLGDSSSCLDIVDDVIMYFLSEKVYLFFNYLNAPDYPSVDHDRKRIRVHRTQTSLTALKETENTLMLMCGLAKRWSSWVRGTKDIDSQLREKSIHLLAFISRGTQRPGESPRTAPLICPPILKEEFECCKKPSFINSRNGWFALSPLCCILKPKFSAVSTSTALVIKDRATGITDPVSQTYFSDSVAMQIYRIAFLNLKFLCLQAEGTVNRAEEVGFVDLAHFPELPMPEILHGLQDQAVAVVTELCQANKLKQINPEIQCACLLLLQIMEMALYLELCVLQICGIRPVLGRVEEFSKEAKSLIKATEGRAFLKAPVKSLRQIISLLYPGLI